MASSIVTVSVIDAWKEGTTVDVIKAVQAKIEAVAQSFDGVILLRFGNDEANQRNAVSEVYRITVRAEHAGTSGTGAGADGGVSRD